MRAKRTGQNKVDGLFKASEKVEEISRKVKQL